MLDTLSSEQKVLYDKLLEEKRLLKIQAKDLHNKCFLFDKELTEYELKYKEKIASVDDRLDIKTKITELCNEYLTGNKRYKEINEEISKIHIQLTNNLVNPKFNELWTSKGVSFEERKILYDAITTNDNVNDLVNISPIFKTFYDNAHLD